MNHKEAFCLMWYACKTCGHQERMWNSRDGVTPFGMQCPSCGDSEMFHDRWQEDKFAPDHKPHDGQRVWVDMTLERAQQYADARIANATVQGFTVSASRRQRIIDSIYRDGAAPDLVVWGRQ